MDNLKNAMVYVAADGDSVGSKVGRAALSDNAEELNSISKHIEAGNEVIRDFCRKEGGEVISSGGDELNMRIPLEGVEQLETLRSDYSFTVGATLTLGVGESLSQANKALNVGKLRGKNQICQYDDSVEQEFQKSSQEANAGSPEDQEKKKIGEAYMKKPQNTQKGQLPDEGNDNSPNEDSSDNSDCPYCEEENNDLEENENCPYCSDEDQSSDQNTDTSDCPYCEESHAEADHPHGDDCPHCQELDQGNPQSGDPRLSVGDQSVNPDSVNAPAMEEDGPGGQNAFDGTPSEQESLAQAYPGKDAVDSGSSPAPAMDGKPQEPFAEEHKTPDEVLSEFDAVHGDPSQEDDSKFEQIDDTGIAEAGNRQEDNVSRPEDFNEEIPVGNEDPKNTDGSQEPNYGAVMQEDLNNNSDDIAKEKVGNMVREALMNFKNTKQYLEQAQQQAPEFYAANVSLIRALIEATKLLGFGGQPQDNQQDQPELGQQEAEMIPEQEAAKPDMADPFPKHPDQGGESKDATSNGTKPPERKQSDWSNPFPKHEENKNSDMGDAGDKDVGKPKAPPKA